MSDHTTYMGRALDLARRAEGYTSPNPMVGAVVVRNGSIVGEGYHHHAGAPHAEVNALREAGDATHGATLYVTLEPCNHHGRTPPCTDAILQAGITHVVYAVPDPHPAASGGAQRLAAAGVTITSHVCHAEATYLNRAFFHHVQTQRPYVIAKYAMSLDGKIATSTGHSQWITGEPARQRVHQLRHAVDAVLVGAGTATADNPRLTVRMGQVVPRHPLRVVLDSGGRVPLHSTLFAPHMPGKTLVVTTAAMPPAHRAQLDRQRCAVLCAPADDHGRVDLHYLLAALGERQVQSLLVEGGGTVLGALFDAGLINECWAFVAPILIGGSTAPVPIGGAGIAHMHEAPRLTNVAIEHVGSDILIRGLIAVSKV